MQIAPPPTSVSGGLLHVAKAGDRTLATCHCPIAMTTDDFAPSHSGSTWVGRFGAHLMQLQPSMKVVNAVQHAVATWPYAAHMEPEEAAEIMRSRLRGDSAGSRAPAGG